MSNKKISRKKIFPEAKLDSPTYKSTLKINDYSNSLIWVLVIICSIIYMNTCLNDYCLDDTLFITENKTTQKGFSGITEHIGQDLLYGYKQVKSKTAASSGWRPLSLITYSIEIGIFGKNKPGISHLINVLLFSGIVVLLFLLFYKFLFKDIWLSFVSALLFAIHPIHTEVVANIKGRDELLCLLFLLLSLFYLWKHVQSSKHKQLFLSFLFFFISLTAKENSFTFLLGIPVMLYFFSNLKTKEIVKYAGGFLVVSLFYLLIRNSIVPFGGTAPNPEIINNAYLFAKGLEPLFTKLYVLLFDLKMLFFPHPLSYDYSFNQIPYKNIDEPWVWVSVFVFVVMFITAIAGFKKKNVFSFCLIMLLITLSIGSNLFVDIGMIFGERLLFIPSIYFCLFLVLAGNRLINHPALNTKKSVLAIILITPLFLAGSYKTITRNAEWKDEQSLTLADISKSPNSARANCGAGGACLFYSFNKEIPKSRRDSFIMEAIGYLKKSIQIYPEYNDALLNLGVAYSQIDSTVKAEVYWEKVRNSSPNHPKLKYFDNFLADKYLNEGMDYARKNTLDSSLYYFNKALFYSSRNDSLKVNCLYNLGGLYFTTGNFEKAHEAFGKIMEINPDYQNARQGFLESGKLLGK